MKILGVIPSRYDSTRFPGKPLANIEGKSMIRRVYEQACKAKKLSSVIVATDDERIFSEVKNIGGEVMMTRKDHQTGTDRIIEVMDNMQGYDAFVNIQGDEPFIDPGQIDLVCTILESHSLDFVATLFRKSREELLINNPNSIKVTIAYDGRALYFSRAAIPFLLGKETSSFWMNENGFNIHIGIYGYPEKTLQKIRMMKRSPLEIAESLEQLRWVENSIPIFTAESGLETISVDTPDDLARAKSFLQNQ